MKNDDGQQILFPLFLEEEVKDIAFDCGPNNEKFIMKKIKDS